MTATPLGWIGIARLGLVQTALGAIVVLTTSTMNRIMVVELALPAILPGALVTWHYALQALRPRFGYGSDQGGRRTKWIIGGMAVLGAGGIGAALATAWMATNIQAGIALAVLAFTLIGIGVGAAGTSLLALMATHVSPDRRAAAAMIMWMMMIAGIVVTTIVAGHYLDPYTPTRLVAVTAGVAALALVVTVLAVLGVERPASELALAASSALKQPFAQALREVWDDPLARGFTVFVFLSMLAYSAQDLILEPFAGAIFGLSPGESTKLAGIQHGGVFTGMLLAGLLGSGPFGRSLGSLKGWTIGGCVASAIALGLLAVAAFVGPAWPIRLSVFALGASNGVFAVAAIGSMMKLAGEGQASREGTRIGLWGAAQAFAFGLGGFLGTAFVDLARVLLGVTEASYAIVFAAEGLLFLLSGVLAARLGSARGSRREAPVIGAVHSVRRRGMRETETYDAVVVGGGPAGATAAHDLALKGRSVLLMDRAGRIKPCGGAIPPVLMREFDIPDRLLVARTSGARIFAPSAKRVDMPIENGFVGMVDRDVFDEWLRERAASAGAARLDASFESFGRDDDGTAVISYATKDKSKASVRARTVIGADGALSLVARQAVPSANRVPYVFAYHEIVRTKPHDTGEAYDPTRCDIYYQGAFSPDFYAWVFPHGDTASIGTGSANKGFSLRQAVGALRQATGLDGTETVRREGAPIPLRPLKKWDNGRDVVLAGDAPGVVAPASGEGIYYAMTGGRLAADAIDTFLETGDVRALATARKRFMKAHGRVFLILSIMQRFWYSSEWRRERFVTICKDRDVQRLTWESYMNKKLVRSRPVAHVRIFFKDLAHLFGLVSP